jgi:hypothetical protein
MRLTATLDPVSKPARSYRRLLAVLSVVALVGLVFIAVAALPYYRLDPNSFRTYWPRRWWLLTHITGGIVALLSGPVQLWLGLTDRRPALHRRLGMVYLAAVAVSAAAGYYLAFHTDVSLVFGAGLAGLATAWLVSSGMAYAAIRRLLFEQHKEWMIRSYVLTTAFVSFRALVVLLEATKVGADTVPRLEIASWFCWAMPLVITEAWIQGRKIFAVPRSG